jgi:hypothetical protein
VKVIHSVSAIHSIEPVFVLKYFRLNMENPEQSLERLRSAAEKLKSFYRLAKQDIANILFVSQGLKPTARVEMLFKENTPSDNREEFEGNIRALEAIFANLGLAFEKMQGFDDDVNVESVSYFIAQNEAAKDEIVAAADIRDPKKRAQIMGKTYGIPQTAIDAFGKGKRYVASREDLPEEIWNSKELRLANFLPSKDHWQDELETMREKIQKIEAVLPGYLDNL